MKLRKEKSRKDKVTEAIGSRATSAKKAVTSSGPYKAVEGRPGVNRVSLIAAGAAGAAAATFAAVKAVKRGGDGEQPQST
jgi:hypothetical protein